MDIVSALSNLFFTHDRVIINGLGEFVLEVETGAIHPVEHSFTPEFKRIRFKLNEKLRDDLLEKYLKEQGSDERIDEFVAQVKTALKEGKKFQLKNIGFLYAHHSGEIVLDQDRSFNYVKKNFGLQDFIQKPVQKASPKEEKPKVAATLVAEKKSPLGWIIAVAAVFILGVLVFWQWDQIRDWTSGSRSIVQHKETEQTETLPVEKEENDMPVADVNQQDTLPLEDTTKEIATANTEGETEEETTVSEAGDQPGGEKELADAQQAEDENKTPAEAKPQLSGVVYYVIAGCFESPAKADEMARNLQNEGFSDAQVHGKIGRLHRVCYTAFPTRREASNYMLKLQKEGYKGVWIQRARW